MDLDEAIAISLDRLQAGTSADYGYDFYPTRLAHDVARERNAGGVPGNERLIARELSPLFMDAGWELCRRGILRPGVRRLDEQSTAEVGYSLTKHGEQVLPDIDAAAMLLMQPGSLAATFAGYDGRFGEGFNQRAQEAIRCRSAEAWLACCAMAGAAAESVLLAIAIAKTNNEDRVLRTYSGAQGRRNILNLIVGQARGPDRRMLTDFTGIISNWRDEAAHGQASPIGTANADESLRQLLHMCQWVDRRWGDLTA